MGRIRWDRLARLTLLIVFALIAGLWIQNGLALISAKRAAGRAAAAVHALQVANARLEARERTLKDPVAIQRAAHALGMVQAAERPYVVSGLSGH